MKWITSSLATGMQVLFNSQSANQEKRIQHAVEDIREAMLQALSRPGAGPADATKLELKVTYANDLQDLWYLRGDVMASVAAAKGEAAARTTLNQISEMFKGLLPKSQTSRPSSLGE